MKKIVLVFGLLSGALSAVLMTVTGLLITLISAAVLRKQEAA